MRQFPPVVEKLVNFHNAWIVGTSALEEQVVIPNATQRKDIDVLVPFREWPAASQLIPANAMLNSLGGWKFVDENVSVDVWPGELGEFLLLKPSYCVFHPRTGRRYILHQQV